MKCVISGSFRKFYNDIAKLAGEFESRGMKVLSPKISRVKNPGEDFIILESDETSDIKELEQQHLNAIQEANFLYVYNPDGYLGQSTTLEIGYALGLGKPVYAFEKPSDETLSRFVEKRSVNLFFPK